MAEKFYAVFGFSEDTTSDTLNRKAGKEGEVLVGPANAEDAKGFPLGSGLKRCYMVALNAENKADAQKAIRTLYGSRVVSEVLTIKEANLEK